jgi:hypothetical protein
VDRKVRKPVVRGGDEPLENLISRRPHSIKHPRASALFINLWVRREARQWSSEEGCRFLSASAYVDRDGTWRNFSQSFGVWIWAINGG